MFLLLLLLLLKLPLLLQAVFTEDIGLTFSGDLTRSLENADELAATLFSLGLGTLVMIDEALGTLLILDDGLGTV